MRADAISVVSVLLLSAASCGRVPSVAQPPGSGTSSVAARGDFGDTLFFPGESMTWDVRWLDVLMGGMSLAVGQPGRIGGSEVLVVRVEAHTAGVLAALKKAQSDVTTMLDVETGVPLKVAGNIDDLYSGELFDADYKQREVNRDWKTWSGSLDDGTPVTEIAGTLGLLRGWRGREGEKAHFFARLRGRTFRVDVVARATEKIRNRGESIRVRRVDGIFTRMRWNMEPDLSDTYPFIGWGTDDERRIPVRIHVQNQWGGTVALEMTSYVGHSGPAKVASRDNLP